MRFAFLFLAFFLLGAKCDRPATHTFPRRELHEDDWTTEVPREEVYKYQMVSGGEPTHKVIAWKADVPKEHRKWLKSTLFIQQSCPLTARWDWCQREQYPTWIKAHRHENPDYAIEYAVYRNLKAGCNWFLLDSEGDPLEVWGPHCMLDMSDNCPKGVWGPTAGLTVAEYMSSDEWLDIFTKSNWDKAFDIYQVEDGPVRGTACWLWRDRLIPYKGRLMTCEHYRDQIAWPAMTPWLETCVKTLGRRGVIVRSNGHFSPHNPRFQWPEIGESFAACELEGFGSWGHAPGAGAWPGWEMGDWATVYMGVEEFFEPWCPWGKAEGTRWDGYQGWDLSSCQVRDYGHAHQKKMVSLALQGDAFIHVVRHDDPDGINRPWEPIDLAPELKIHLGAALGPSQTHKKVLYRYFAAGYTVVCNPGPAVAGIPAESGRWYKGEWPDGDYRLVTYGPAGRRR